MWEQRLGVKLQNNMILHNVAQTLKCNYVIHAGTQNILDWKDGL